MWSNSDTAPLGGRARKARAAVHEADSGFPVIDIDISSFGPDVETTHAGLPHDMSCSARPDIGPRAATPCLPRDAMLRFRDLMAVHGHVISISRMRFDFVYAVRQLVAADASGHPELRRLSMDIFNLYHGMQVHPAH